MSKYFHLNYNNTKSVSYSQPTIDTNIFNNYPLLSDDNDGSKRLNLLNKVINESKYKRLVYDNNIDVHNNRETKYFNLKLHRANIDATKLIYDNYRLTFNPQKFYDLIYIKLIFESGDERIIKSDLPPSYTIDAVTVFNFLVYLLSNISVRVPCNTSIQRLTQSPYQQELYRLNQTQYQQQQAQYIEPTINTSNATINNAVNKVFTFENLNQNISIEYSPLLRDLLRNVFSDMTASNQVSPTSPIMFNTNGIEASSLVNIFNDYLESYIVQDIVVFIKPENGIAKLESNYQSSVGNKLNLSSDNIIGTFKVKNGYIAFDDVINTNKLFCPTIKVTSVDHNTPIQKFGFELIFYNSTFDMIVNNYIDFKLIMECEPVFYDKENFRGDGGSLRYTAPNNPWV